MPAWENFEAHQIFRGFSCGKIIHSKNRKGAKGGRVIRQRDKVDWIGNKWVEE